MVGNGWRALTSAEMATNPVALNFLPIGSTETSYTSYQECYKLVLSNTTPSSNSKIAEVQTKIKTFV